MTECRAILIWEGTSPDGGISARVVRPIEGPEATRGDLRVEAKTPDGNDDWGIVGNLQMRCDLLEIALQDAWRELSKHTGNSLPVKGTDRDMALAAMARGRTDLS